MKLKKQEEVLRRLVYVFELIMSPVYPKVSFRFRKMRKGKLVMFAHFAVGPQKKTQDWIGQYQGESQKIDSILESLGVGNGMFLTDSNLYSSTDQGDAVHFVHLEKGVNYHKRTIRSSLGRIGDIFTGLNKVLPPLDVSTISTPLWEKRF